MDIISLLTISGLVLYILNYLTGLALSFRLIKLSRLPHQIIYTLLIFNIILLLVYLNFLSNKFLLYLFSLALLLALPLGKKGGAYHIIISTLGLSLYLFTMLNYQYFRLID